MTRFWAGPAAWSGHATQPDRSMDQEMGQGVLTQGYVKWVAHPTKNLFAYCADWLTLTAANPTGSPVGWRSQDFTLIARKIQYAGRNPKFYVPHLLHQLTRFGALSFKQMT